MRDLAVLLTAVGLVVLALARPWLGVLALTVVGYARPQSYAAGFMAGAPLSKVLFVATVVGAAVALWQGRLRLARPPVDWRLLALAALWAWFLFTTWQSPLPWAAWPRLAEVTKVFLILALTVVLIDTREKLRCLLVAVAASIALVMLKGGYWAVMTGFTDRVYGPPGSHFYGNNHFAVLMVMALPLLLLWRRETESPALRWVLAGVVALGVAAVLSSWSRGALLALGATALVLLAQSRQRLVGLAVVGLALVLVQTQIPDRWLARMGSIGTYEEDASALNRLDAWRSGVEHALANPFTGAGFDGWRLVNMDALARIDWHNAYVEVLAEHGFVGLTLWLALLVGAVIDLARLMRRREVLRAAPWLSDYAQGLIASLAGFAAGAMFSGLAYWDIWLLLVVASVLVRRFAQAAVEVSGPGEAAQPWRPAPAGAAR